MNFRFELSFIIFIILILFSGACVPASAENTDIWTPEDMMQVATVTNVCPSPDGTKVVYTVKNPLLTENRSELHSQSFVKNLDQVSAQPLMTGDASSSLPRWSPDGTRIAFLSDISGVNNIWVISSGGGVPEQITSMDYPVQDLQWSPDGSIIAFTMPEAVPNEVTARIDEMNDREVIGEDPPRIHLWLVQSAKNSIPYNPVSGENSVSSFDWAPDGQSIVFSHQKTAEFKYYTHQDISILDINGGTIKPFASSAMGESNPLYSPDGCYIAYISTPAKAPECLIGTNTVVVAPLSGKESRSLALTPNKNPHLISWSADGKSIWFSEFRGTQCVMGLLPTGGGEPVDFLPKDGSLLPFDQNSALLNSERTMIGYSWQNSTTPNEGYVTSAYAFDPVQITNQNEEFLNYPLSKTETISWQSTDGRTIDGVLTYPLNHVEGKRYPLIVMVHGGPATAVQEMYYPAYGTDIFIPLPVYSSHGYAILMPNYRGSTGRGSGFREATDWGGMDYEDIMCGVDYLVSEGIADPERLGVIGHSYGGFMTDWIVTHTDRFKAAVSYAGMSDLIGLIGTSDFIEPIPSELGADYWDDYQLYLEHSPIYSVKKVSTPVLFIHGSDDARVPPSQAQEMYVALSMRGVPTRMVMYPREGHVISEPKHMMDYWQESLDWFDKYLN